MENKELGDIIGSPDAPYLNQLADTYALATESYGLRHPSLPNYLALLGGYTFGISSDCLTCFQDAPNLVDSLEAHGKSWRAYMEDMPTPCYLGRNTTDIPDPDSDDGDSGDYVLKHNPFFYFQDVRTNPTRCAQVVPGEQLTSDLANGTVPDFVWITPDLEHDMHEGSVAEGDAWLADTVPQILDSPAWQDGGLLIITWDEGTTDAGYDGDTAGGHIPTLVISPNGPRGARSAVSITPYSILRGIEDIWGLEHLGHAGDPGVTSLLAAFTP